MQLAKGARLGPYVILAPLGAGGMGEVYRARDERLGREVAIKVLREGVASKPQRLQRFEREARAASFLNHPNLITIYDVGSAGEMSFIAMELVRGTPLREILTRTALPGRKLLQLGAQIAEGLARAHEAGIVHRDLKPENLMVTEDGLVKILDFGLAKLIEPDSSKEATLARRTAETTTGGVVMGTVGYMSPEQAVGEPVDFRSDQFSLGAILYEMATGRRAFLRESSPETLAAIIRDEPEPIAEVSPSVPAPVRWVIERCLAKEPRDRYASTADLARDLATLRDRLVEAASMSAVPPRDGTAGRVRPWRMAAIAAAVILAAAIAGWRLSQSDYLWRNPLSGARYTRFTDWEGSETDAILSRDGAFVAFVSDRSLPPDVWVGQVGGRTFLNLSQGRLVPFGRGHIRNAGFSPDGTQVSFPAQPRSAATRPYQLWLVPTIGGNPQLFLPEAIEATWSPDGGRIAYFSTPGDPIFIADKNGASPRRILEEKPGVHNHYLAWSPGGTFIYFVRGVPPNDMDVWRIRPSGEDLQRITEHHGRVAYPALLDERTLVYCAARDGGGWGLYSMDVERRIPHAVSSGLEEYTSVSSSADGRRLAATVANPTEDLWTAPISDRVVEESGVTRFELPTMRASGPRYGSGFVLYLSSKGGAQGLWKWMDGSETELWKGTDGPVPFAPGISRDGTRVAFVTVTGGRHSLILIDADGTNARRVAESLDVVDVPSWSPDGDWVAVVASDGEGKRPLYKVPTHGGPPIRVAEGLNADPVWSPDGRLILYSEGLSGNNPLRAVTPDGETVPVPEVFVPYAGNRYRFLPDGKSVVVLIERVEDAVQRQEFHLLDLASGRMRQLTSLRPEFKLRSFDVSPDGERIIFDRYRENADVVLIDLQR